MIVGNSQENIESSKLTSKMAGIGMKKLKYKVDRGKRNMSSKTIALTAPLAP